MNSSPKQLELLATLVPNVSRIGLLGNPNSPTYFSVLKNTQAAAQKVGLFVIPIKARNPIETENAFAQLGKGRAWAPPRNPLCQLTAGSGCPGSARRSLGQT
jgi:ABC-type uncharacterized transport system substrate-binding protein